MRKFRRSRICAIALQAAATCLSFSTAQAGSWQPTANPFPDTDIVDSGNNVVGPGGPAEPLLMTDGSVLVFDIGYSGSNGRVFKFTPDSSGSYINGTWSELAAMPYAPIYASQAVLADGRVIVEGGEYTDLFDFTLTNEGAIYDPVTNSWTSVPPPLNFKDLYPPRRKFAPHPIGDAANVILPDGSFMVHDKMSWQAARLNLTALTWTYHGTSTKADMNDEEGWTLLPNGKVLTVDCYTDYYFGITGGPYPPDPTHSEIYDPHTGTWSSAGSTINTLTDPYLFETGAAILRPDGTVFAMGSQGFTSIYDTQTGTWSAGPKVPLSPGGNQYTMQDAPGVLLTSGNVLFAASGGATVLGNYTNPPVGFFEFDGTNLIAEPTIPNAANDTSGSVSLLPLPNGQVLAVDNTNDVEIYTPDAAAPDPAWAPANIRVRRNLIAGASYKLVGVRLNGMSQACAFGDEEQCATNYPLVRITNVATGHVFYSRTHDHTSMAVASPNDVATHFDIPADQESGPSTLEVVANGIASQPVSVRVTAAPGRFLPRPPASQRAKAFAPSGGQARRAMHHAHL